VYVALGDSTVEGIGASHPSRSYASLVYSDLSRHYAPVDYRNFGKGGARVSDVVTTQLNSAVEAHPQLITLSIGANDVIKRTSLRLFRADLQRLLQTLREHTSALIVMTNVPDFSFHRRIPGSVKPVVRLRIQQYNSIITRAAQIHDVVLVDTFKESATTALRFPEAVSSDNFHPSDLGYTLWANTMLTVIHEELGHKKHGRTVAA
jgi:lysophospholipase L1-like esterase